MVRPMVVLVLLGALAGCATEVAGTAVPNESAAKEALEPLTAQRALGELSSLNYCSLTDQQAFPKRLGLVAVAARASYNGCHFTVQTNGTEIDVRVGYLDNEETLSGIDHTADRSRNPPRGLRVHRGEESAEACVRLLGFTDEVWLTVLASNESKPGGDWCAIADATLDIVIDRILAKKVRHYEFGDQSWGRVDACGVVPAELVGATIGSPGTKPLRFPSGHECHWTGPASENTVARLFITPGMSSRDASHTEKVVIAGRPTLVTASMFDDEDLSMCQVETETTAQRQRPVAEFALVEVLVLGKENDSCTPARRLAEEVWQRLPR